MAAGGASMEPITPEHRVAVGGDTGADATLRKKIPKYSYVGPRRGKALGPDPWLVERKRRRRELKQLERTAHKGHPKPTKRQVRGLRPGPGHYSVSGPANSLDGSTDGTGRTDGGGGPRALGQTGLQRGQASFSMRSERVGVPASFDPMPTQGNCTKSIKDEYFSRPAADHYDVVSATDVRARLRECDHTYAKLRLRSRQSRLRNSGNGTSGDCSSGTTASSSTSATLDPYTVCAARRAARRWLAPPGSKPGSDSSYGQAATRKHGAPTSSSMPSPAAFAADVAAATAQMDSPALAPLDTGEEEWPRAMDRTLTEAEPDPLRRSASFASDTMRFDIPVAAMNFRYKSCPKAHVVPDAAFPADINAPLEVSAGVAIGKEERPELFGSADLEAGQEAFYRPRHDLERDVKLAPCSTRYMRGRHVPRRTFPAFVLHDSEWGGMYAQEGHGPMGAGDYECQKPSSIRLLDPKRQSATFSSTSTREPLFCQNPKLRTDLGFNG